VSGAAALAVGAEVGFDGIVWRVVAWEGPGVVLLDGAQQSRRVEVGDLLSRAVFGGPAGAETAGAALSGLTKSQRSELARRVEHVQEVLTGFRRGDVALALPGEPRAPFGPGGGMMARYRAKASELDTSVMTVRRMVSRFAEAGPAGLIDRRWTRGGDPFGGVDPRWLAMVHTVLAEHAEASTPTRQLVLERVGARLDAEHGAGVVSLPGRTKALALFEALRPLPQPAARWVEVRAPYHGLPQHVVVDAARLVDGEGRALLPSVAAETVVVDHGRIYLSEHLMSVCARLGVSVQPARPYQGTDKAALERFFRTLREQLLVALPGYKGPDVYHRGSGVEDQAFYFLDELEAIIRQWLAVYHRAPHEGLCEPHAPGLELCPLEMFGHGVARAGFLQVPARADLVYDFLQVRWRTIQHYGVEIAGLRYDGPALGPYRGRTSAYSGRYQGKWPIRVDPGDVSQVYFHDPVGGPWHALAWEHADQIAGPFSDEAVAYARALAGAVPGARHVDTRSALAALLEAWGSGLTRNPVERRVALRQGEHRLRLVGPPGVAKPGEAFRPAAPEPGAGDDDVEEEPTAQFPDERHLDGEDFYADALEAL
jgi:hypothetical protein